MAKENVSGVRKMLLVSEFDQTRSFNDSRIVLSEMLDIPGFGATTAAPAFAGGAQ
jgi:hypothetical protein